jgi:hypothetical protein
MRNRIVYLLFFLCLLSVACSKKTVQPETPAPPPPPPMVDEIILQHPRFFVTTEDIPRIKQTAGGSAAWTDLRNRMNNALPDREPEYGFTAVHFVMAYIIEGDKKYADRAIRMVMDQVARINDARSGSFLRSSGFAMDAATVADVCHDLLSADQKTQIYDYLETLATEIVEVKNWSGWGWIPNNPLAYQLNNYHTGHLLTIYAYAATCYYERAKAKTYFDLIIKDKLPDVFLYLKNADEGGAGAEGTHYSAKYNRDLAELVKLIKNTTGKKRDFAKDNKEVFRGLVEWKLRAIQPEVTENGKSTLYRVPFGDQPQDQRAEIDDFTNVELGLYLSLIHDIPELSNEAQYAKHFIKQTGFRQKGHYRWLNLYHIVFDYPAVPMKDHRTALSKAYYAGGKGVVQYRSGWDADAAVFNLHFSPAQGQKGSHWHFKEGEINIWKHGWQGVDLNTLPSSNGIQQQTALGNLTYLVNDAGQSNKDATVIHYAAGNDYVVTTGDMEAVYPALTKAVRSCIISGNALTVLDNISGAPSARISLAVNSYNAINTQGNTATSSNGTGKIQYQFFNTVNTITNKANGIFVSVQIPASGTLTLLTTATVGEQAAVLSSVELVAATGFRVAHIKDGSKEYVHALNTGSSKVSSLHYTVENGTGQVSHIINGLQMGNYSITRQGSAAQNLTVDATGVLSFTVTGNGTYTITRQ